MFGSRQKSGGASKERARIGRDVAARLAANPRVHPAMVGAAQAFYHQDFLTPDQCDHVIALIESNRRPSTLLAEREEPGFRTSESCDMDRYSPDVAPIDTSIAELLGIDPRHGETMQGQRYAPGQHFRAHHDFFHETQGYWPKMKATGGQRTWTAMIFLNDVAEGGATWFPQAGLRVAPRRGLLFAWNNMGEDGRPNPLTLHEGMPVIEGVKYIVTKWFREGNWIDRY
ncbi:prolyl hydroxylase family protein [uncultured Sphingomonas sp.]|uniref:prolyl hydroxylase family protein n=1 Tax=uncultured Sphingomonas sp. TaxID=158754 RepID=UPI0035CBEB40